MKKTKLRTRNPYVLAQLRGEIKFKESSESTKKKKFSRKEKHKKKEC